MNETKLDSVLEDDVWFSDEDIFGDDEEHNYVVKCFDGCAIGYKADDEDENASETVHVTYPLKAKILKDKSLSNAILEYRGLYDLEPKDITYGDIMMYMGELDV